MFRSLAIMFPLLALLLTLFIGTSSAIGNLQPVHPISTQLSHCADHIICWLGIDITQTPVDEARLKLELTGYQVSDDNPNIYVEAVSGCSARVMALSTHPSQIGALGVECETLRIGEVMAALGAPDRVGYSCDGHYIFYYGYNLVLNLGDTLAPNAPVELLVLSRIVTGTYQRRWYGFALAWRYIGQVC